MTRIITLLELGNHLFKTVGSNNLGPLGLVLEEIVDLLCRSVVGANLESVVIHVEDEVLTHHGEADEGDVAVRGGHLANCSSIAHQVLTTTTIIINTLVQKWKTIYN